MENTLQYRAWWKQLEPQWREAFGMAVLKHFNEPDDADLEMLFSIEAIRMAGPAAPFPNMRFELTNLSGIAHLSNLKIVIITHHQVQSIEEISSLVNMKSLFLLNNVITSLTGIERLKGLEQLYIQCNKISSLQPIEQLTNLREVYINDNCISSLAGLTEEHSDKLKMFVCRPNDQLKQKEIIRVERELGIICKGI